MTRYNHFASTGELVVDACASRKEGDSSFVEGETMCETLDSREVIAYLKGKMETQHSLFTDQIKTLNLDLERIKHERWELEFNKTHAATKLATLSQELETSQNKNEKLIAELEMLCIELRDVRAEQAETKTKFESLEEELRVNEASIRTEIAVLSEELAKLKQTRENLQDGKARTVWKRTGDVVITYDCNAGPVIDLLNCPVLHMGIHKWKVCLEALGGCRLGVVSSEQVIDVTTTLGEQVGTWGYGGWGDAWYNKQLTGYFPKYDYAGSVITMVLDLTEEGTLSYAIDNLALIEVFGNMKSMLNSNNASSGFVPAAILYQNARIRFLGFHE